jgi:spermidine synthase
MTDDGPGDARANRPDRLPAWAPVGLCFVSGAVALAYETLWMRAFASLFGATAPAAAVTISALFAGLAAGSAWFGKRAPRVRRPLLLYAGLETAAAVAALAVLALARLYSDWTPALQTRLGSDPGLLALLKGLLALLALFPPAFFLGGTLPVLTEATDDRRGGGGLGASRFYAANTLGGVAGCLAVPFALLPYLGASRGYRLLVLVSLALGLAALVLDRRLRTAARTPSATSALGLAEPRAPASATGVPHALAFASGFLALGLEVVWMRMLSQVHPNSIQAYAVVLAVFLGALFAGASIGLRLARRGGATWPAAPWIASGLLTLAAPPVFVAATRGLRYVADADGGGYLASLLSICASTFVPATVCAGTILPLLLARAAGPAAPAGPASPEVGRLLAFNTAGCILGPLVTTFALFPWLGMWGSAVALGVAELAVPLLVLRRPAWSGGRLLALAAPAGLLAWLALEQPRVRIDEKRGEELVWLREGSHGIASVVRDPGGLRLKLDNAYTLGGSATPGDARVLGHLPLLAHDAPRRVAFLGLGTGITASAALVHDIEEATLFELSPEVALAARTVFAEANRRLLEDPRVRLVVDDALSHLRATPGRFDVVVGDLVVPWRRGESALFTREHFEDVRRALAPGGLFCQWLPLYQMSEEELRIVVATFLDVFPRASVWRGDFVAARPTLGLMGRAGEEPLAVDAIDARASALADELALDSGYLAHPAGVWVHLVGGLERGAPWVARTRRSTRDMPWLELLSARSARRRPGESRWFTGAPLLAFLEEFHRDGAPEAEPSLDAEHRRWRDVGEALFQASCLDAEGREEEARSLAFGALAALPSEIQETLLGTTLPAPGG